MAVSIFTWNVNALKSKVGLVNELLKRHNIDILVLTETKIIPSEEAALAAQILPEYACIWNSNKAAHWHGVAILYRHQVFTTKLLYDYLPATDRVISTSQSTSKNQAKIRATSLEQINRDVFLAYNSEGRLLAVQFQSFALSQSFLVVGTYVPNSGVNRTNPLARLAFRTLRWDHDLQAFLTTLQQQYGHIIWTGDLNVIAKDYDVNFRNWNIAGTTPEERQNFLTYFSQDQWIDTWEVLNPNNTTTSERATYGIGRKLLMRLDYVLCTPTLRPFLRRSLVDQSFTGSDHVPMGTTFDFSISTFIE